MRLLCLRPHDAGHNRRIVVDGIDLVEQPAMRRVVASLRPAIGPDDALMVIDAARLAQPRVRAGQVEDPRLAVGRTTARTSSAPSGGWHSTRSPARVSAGSPIIQTAETPASMQELRASEHVLILGCTGRPRAVRLMELSSITDAEPVVDRKHDETVSREILIYRIGIAVIVHAMPAEQHLTR